MPEKKIIAVVGATGAQGGGLARAILADRNGGFAVRAITRKPESEKAQALKNAGAELVTADADDASSIRRASLCIVLALSFATRPACASLLIELRGLSALRNNSTILSAGKIHLFLGAVVSASPKDSCAC